MPNILIYIDDIDSNTQEFTKRRYQDFEITFVEDSQIMYKTVLSNFDAILIDYGRLGDDTYLMRKLVKCRKPLAWYSALSGRCNDDAKRHFPDIIDFHGLPHADLNELGWLLNEMFPDIMKY